MKIALGGKMGSGKTTVAKYLVRDYDFWRYAIANHIREIANEIRLRQPMVAAQMVYDLLDGKGNDIYIRMLRLFMESENKSNRWLLQALGTDIVRSYDEDAWIKYLLNQIGDKSFVVIDDVRFQNELDLLEDEGYITVWINCPKCWDYLMARDGYVEGENHSSETQLSGEMFDYVLENDGDLENMYMQVDAIIHQRRCL